MHLFERKTILLLLAFAAAPIFAADADLVRVTTHVSSPTANPGGTNRGEILVENISTADVRVRMDVRVVYSDGTVQILAVDDPGTIPPDGGFVQSIHFIIPMGATVGNATFSATATASSGGQQETETSSATFLVLP